MDKFCKYCSITCFSSFFFYLLGTWSHLNFFYPPSWEIGLSNEKFLATPLSMSSSNCEPLDECVRSLLRRQMESSIKPNPLVTESSKSLCLLSAKCSPHEHIGLSPHTFTCIQPVNPYKRALWLNAPLVDMCYLNYLQILDRDAKKNFSKKAICFFCFFLRLYLLSNKLMLTKSRSNACEASSSYHGAN